MSIWDEKPNKDKWVTFKIPIKSRQEIQLLVYDSAEMDSWLETLKEEWDAILKHHVTQEQGQENLIVEQEHKLNDFNQKLEAIKKLPDKHKVITRSGRFFHINTLIRSNQARKLIEELVEILEAS